MNLNKELYDKVLSHRFPDVLTFDGAHFLASNGYVFDISKNLNDAFFFATELGLFKDHYLNCEDNWVVHVDKDEYHFSLGFVADGDTPQEAIVRALIAVYGKEE